MIRNLELKIFEGHFAVVRNQAVVIRVQFCLAVCRHGHSVRRKFDRSIESKLDRIGRRRGFFKGLNLDEINIADALAKALVTLDLRRKIHVREEADSVNEQHRLAVDANVIRMPEIAHDVEDDRAIIFVRVLLSDKDLILETIPSARPVLVSPDQTEGHVWFVRFQVSLERQIQKALPGKPVIKIAEAVKTIAFGKLGLMLGHLVDAKIVKAQVSREMRLVMADVIRLRLGNIIPIGKSFSPPAIVFGDRMILR